jgi:hypothetical protein
MKFRKKPVVIEATQWFKDGDHSEAHPNKTVTFADLEDGTRGVVATPPCQHCGKAMDSHGSVPTLEGIHIVCPGDWIITGVKGEHYPCKPDIFAMTYEAIE